MTARFFLRTINDCLDPCMNQGEALLDIGDHQGDILRKKRRMNEPTWQADWKIVVPSDLLGILAKPDCQP